MVDASGVVSGGRASQGEVPFKQVFLRGTGEKEGSEGGREGGREGEETMSNLLDAATSSHPLPHPAYLEWRGVVLVRGVLLQFSNVLVRREEGGREGREGRGGGV